MNPVQVYLLSLSSIFHHCHSQSVTPPQPAIDDIDILGRLPGNCTDNQFDCGERCIPIRRFRDCHQDCDDGSDEACWPGFVRCPVAESGCACVKQADASKLCAAKKENKFCALPEQQVFHCKNGNCIPKQWVNDQMNDCGDWSDEQLSALQPTH